MKRVATLLVGLMMATTATAGVISLRAADGTPIKAEQSGNGDRGVVLVHSQGRDRSDWSTFAEKLSDHGFNVVALDLRGHGESSGPEVLGEADYAAMVQEVEAAAGYLRQKGAQSVTVIGAKLGASLALHAGAGTEDVSNVVMLSPGLNVLGLKVSRALTDYGAKPILLVASDTDSGGSRAAEAIKQNALGDADFELLTDAGVGVRMLNRSPDLEGLIISWLSGTFKINKGVASSKEELQTGDVSALETTGLTLGQ